MTRSLTKVEMDDNSQLSHIWKIESMFSQFNFPRFQVWNVARKKEHIYGSKASMGNTQNEIHIQ